MIVIIIIIIILIIMVMVITLNIHIMITHHTVMTLIMVSHPGHDCSSCHRKQSSTLMLLVIAKHANTALIDNFGDNLSDYKPAHSNTIHPLEIVSSSDLRISY